MHDTDTTGDASIAYSDACANIEELAAEFRDASEGFEVGNPSVDVLAPAADLATAVIAFKSVDMAFTSSAGLASCGVALRAAVVDLLDAMTLLSAPARRLATGPAYSTAWIAACWLDPEAVRLGAESQLVVEDRAAA